MFRNLVDVRHRANNTHQTQRKRRDGAAATLARAVCLTGSDQMCPAPAGWARKWSETIACPVFHHRRLQASSADGRGTRVSFSSI